LDALAFGIGKKRIHWILDCDVQSFFDKVSREWLVRFVEHRIGDRRIVRLISKWLTAGVLEDGYLIETEEGTPQGAVISPLLANIYLHYVYDLWAHQWRKRRASGDVIVVRYADDSVVGFEHRHEAEQFLADLKVRLACFGLNLHPDKTRLIEFGRFAIADRRAQGLGKPESFAFLGFTHYCATRRNGHGFVLGRKPMAKRMRTKLREIKEKLMATRHDGIAGQGQWLAQVLRGWMAYYAVPMSGSALSAFRHHMIERWHGALMRRSQRRRLTWARMKKVATTATISAFKTGRGLAAWIGLVPKQNSRRRQGTAWQYLESRKPLSPADACGGRHGGDPLCRAAWHAPASATAATFAGRRCINWRSQGAALPT
jgi:RNA-directed DNA polymerase